jgi:hypothetical protein
MEVIVALFLRRFALLMLFATACAVASCSRFQASSASAPAGISSAASAAPQAAMAQQEPACWVNSVKICEDNARERPSLFFPDAVKGKSAENPQGFMAFDAPLQIPGGPTIQVACYYKPDTMVVVYARAWAQLGGGSQLVDLNPRPGQVLNSDSGQPARPPLSERNYRFLRDRGYCMAPPA